MATTEKEITIREKLGVSTPAEVVEFLNMMIFGDPGAGKTRLASTAQDNEETRPMLIIDIDGGLTTIKERSDIDVKPCRSLKDIETIHNDIYADIDKYYKTVVIDSLTELQKLDMKEIMKEAYNKNPGFVDQDVPSPREWGKSLIHMTKIVRAFRDLPCHTIFTCLAAYVVDDATNVTHIHPSLPGKQQKEIPGYLDVIGYLSVKTVNNENVRRVQFEKTARCHVKDRTDSLGGYVDNPTIPLIWEKISSADEKEKK